MNTKLLRQKILDLAIRGKLTDQLKSDGTARDLLTQISDERRKTRDERIGMSSKKSGVILSGARSAKSKEPEQIIPLEKSEAPFEIPANWEWVKLGDVVLNRDAERKPVSKKDRNLHAQKIYDYYGAAGAIDKVEEYLFDEKLLLIGEDGANLLSRSKPNAFLANGKYWVNNHAHVIDAIDKSMLDYLAFYINAISLDDFVTGTAQPKLNQENLNKIPIPLPPLAEQQRIVAKIEEAFAEIDAVEKNKELLKIHIKQTRQKILDLAIHGKLVPQDKADGSARELLSVILSEAQSAKSKDLKHSGKPTADNPHYEKMADVPFEIPDSWEWVKLGEVAYIASGSTPSKDCFVENGVPYLKMYNLRNQQIDFEYKPQYIKREIHEGKLARSKAKLGDVIMNIVGPPLGKVALVPETLPECNFNQAAVLIRAYFDTNLMNQYIRYFLLQMDEINAINTKGTAGQENISLTQTQNMRFPLPPLAEQKRIVDKIEEVFASLDEISLHLV